LWALGGLHRDFTFRVTHSAAMRILVVEDERALARVLTRGLTEEGHAVDVAPDLATARYLLSESAYALVVLDLGLPDGDGTTLCRELRERDDSVPVLMLTARDAVSERIAGLDAGADDYLPKPFDFGELAARVRALLRRPPSARSPQVVLDDFCLDVAVRRVVLDGVLVPLTTREFAVLHHLVTNVDAVVSRTELMESLWDAHYDGLSNVVDVHIRNLRRKLDRPGRPLPIETVRGAGYRFSLASAALESPEQDVSC
jgi:DNA-binding response OmpR family regulator